MNVIYILWLRQVKRYARSRSRIIGSLGQPILFLVALGFGFGPIFEQAGGGDYIQFLAPGIIAMSVLFTSMFSGIDLIWDKRLGFLKETLVAPVSRLQIVLGRTLGGATVGIIQGILVFLLTLVIGFRPENWWLLPFALVFIFLIALLFTALGTGIASFLEDMQAFPIIMNFLIMPVFFLSGALFPLDNLPRGIQLVSYADPLSYGVDGLRGALAGSVYFGFLTDLVVLFIVAGGILAVSSWLFRKIQV
jgi:ABC-2 type transport system permease protein